jgi:YD repeat-containing protein
MVQAGDQCKGAAVPQCWVTAGATMTRLTAITFLALIATVGAANAEERTQQFYNDKGQIIGTATRNGNQTTFRNQKGQLTGTSTTRGNTTIFYDSMGRQQGTATSPGRR